MDNDLSPRPSRSQRKRETLALQQIGNTLVELSSSQLAEIPLDETLADAIREARTITAHEAKRRQLQYIGKLIKHIDIEPIKTALAKVLSKNSVGKAEFHKIERWRDKLIMEGDPALNEFIQQHSQADTQHIRQLIRRAQQDRKQNKNSGAETELFRYIRDL